MKMYSETFSNVDSRIEISVDGNPCIHLPQDITTILLYSAAFTRTPDPENPTRKQYSIYRNDMSYSGLMTFLNIIHKCPEITEDIIVGPLQYCSDGKLIYFTDKKSDKKYMLPYHVMMSIRSKILG